MPLIEPHLDDGDNKVSPPDPRSVLFFDGTQWRVPRIDIHGRIWVRGEDQLFSYDTSVASSLRTVISGADGWCISEIVPDDKVWHITCIVSNDETSPTTEHTMHVARAAAFIQLAERVAAFAAWDLSYVNCDIWMNAGQVIRVTFVGGLANDNCTIRLHGYQMTRET